MTALPLFKMFQTRINYFFDTVKLSAPRFFCVVESLIDGVEAIVYMRPEIAQTRVVDQDSHEYGDCRNSNGQSDLNGLISHRYLQRTTLSALNP
jgi:hypothetical protein